MRTGHGGTSYGAAAGHPPADRPSLHPSRYWSGVAATAAVAAAVGTVGVVIGEGVLELSLLPPRWNVLGLDGHAARYAASAALAAVLAGTLLHLLVVSTPRPTAFFNWIMVILTLGAAAVPLALTDVVADALATGLLNTIIGVALVSLLPSVATLARRGRP